jgi:rhomboid protease GluP
VSDEPRPGPADRLVELAAQLLDALGLNGRRLRWKWNQRRQRLAEAGARTEMTWRGARAAHKMCPACRALVSRSANKCPECGESLASVSAPGFGRMIANVLPGSTAATSLIMLANGVMFLLMLMTPSPEGGGSGMMGFDIYKLLRFGAGSGFLTFQDHEWFRMITSIFVHGGIIHFGFNSYALLRLGPEVEHLYGTERFWVVYLWCGFAGNVAAQGLSTRPVVGASGAICGLIGLLLAYGIRRGGTGGAFIRRLMLQNTILMLVISFVPGVSALSHVGGFAGGFLAGFAVSARDGRRRAPELLWQLASLAAVVAVLAALYAMAVRGEDFSQYL